MTLVKRYRASFCTILAALFSAVTNCTAMPQTQAAAEPPAEEPAAAVVEERAEERSDEVQGLYREEAEYAARVIYGTARNHSKDDQRLVVWHHKPCGVQPLPGQREGGLPAVAAVDGVLRQ